MLFCNYQKLEILSGDINEFAIAKRVRALVANRKSLKLKQITWKGNMYVINTHIHIRARAKVMCKPSTMNRGS